MRVLLTLILGALAVCAEPNAGLCPGCTSSTDSSVKARSTKPRDDTSKNWTLIIDTRVPESTKPCAQFKKGNTAPDAYTTALKAQLTLNGATIVEKVKFKCANPSCGSASQNKRIRALVTTSVLTAQQVNDAATAFLVDSYKTGDYVKAVKDAGVPATWAPEQYLYLQWHKTSDGKAYCSWYPTCVKDLWFCPSDPPGIAGWQADNAVPPSEW